MFVRRCSSGRAARSEALNLAKYSPYFAAPRLALFKPEGTRAYLAADIVYQSARSRVRRDAVCSHLLEGRMYAAEIAERAPTSLEQLVVGGCRAAEDVRKRGEVARVLEDCEGEVGVVVLLARRAH